MNSRKIIFKETAIAAAGVIICTAIMLLIFYLIKKFDSAVVWGAVIGTALAIVNFFLLAISSCLAADKAEAQNVSSGMLLMRGSYFARTIVLFVILYFFVKSGLCNPISSVLPLIFVQPSIYIGEFFRKGREKQK